MCLLAKILHIWASPNGVKSPIDTHLGRWVESNIGKNVTATVIFPATGQSLKMRANQIAYQLSTVYSANPILKTLPLKTYFTYHPDPDILNQKTTNYYTTTPITAAVKMSWEKCIPRL